MNKKIALLLLCCPQLLQAENNLPASRPLKINPPELAGDEQMVKLTASSNLPATIELLNSAASNKPTSDELQKAEQLYANALKTRQQLIQELQKLKHLQDGIQQGLNDKQKSAKEKLGLLEQKGELITVALKELAELEALDATLPLLRLKPIVYTQPKKLKTAALELLRKLYWQLEPLALQQNASGEKIQQARKYLLRLLHPAPATATK